MIDSVSDTLGVGKNDLKKIVKGDSATNIDRLPPHSEEAERGVLGCCLLDPNRCIADCIEKLKDDGKSAFYDLRHQTIYETLVEMVDSLQSVDLITVQQNLKDRQLLDQIGGIAYLSQLQDAVPSAANLSYYLGIIREKYLLRKLIQTCSGVVGRIYDFEGDVEELIDGVESELMSVTSTRAEGGTLDTNALVTEALVEIETAFNTKGAPAGIPTGFTDIDRMLGGLQNADQGGGFYIFAARPSMGKSALMMNMAEHMAFVLNRHVGVFSLEMGARSVIKRSIGSIGRINIREPWKFSESEMGQLNTAQSTIRKSSKFMHVDDTGGLSILELRARARRMVQKYGIEVLFVDFLQLLHGTSKKSKDNRQVEISEISQGLKELSKELGIPVVVLSQLNRDLEKNKRKPRVSDLRESGSLEQDADIIGLLSHEWNEDEDKPVKLPNGAIKTVFDIAKQRNGPTGLINLQLFKEQTRFETLSQFDEVNQPHND